MKFLRLSLLAASLCVAPAPAPGRDTVVAGPMFTVKQGRELKIKGADLRITFLAVEEDSRCPKDVECIQAGNARVRLLARNSKGARARFVLNTDILRGARRYEFGKYGIELIRLSPQPTAGAPKRRAYEAVLSIYGGTPPNR
ncbi:MAG TPA: hypothetical protein VIP46_01350 [Pyrinomonadaceae bacterium]